jgi:CRISPR/Cas system Type II protein with McrA/HNH and RuvC-like nuclease domain
MKKILGLDLGTTSIGWAVVETKNDNSELNTVKTNINDDRIGIFKDAVGVRIIPAEEMHRRFEQGQKLNDKNAKTPTAERRTNRGARRLNSRYKLRRGKLLNVLEFMGILPKGSFKRGEDGRWIDDRNGGKWYTKQKGKTGENFGEKLYELRDRAIREKIDLEDLGRIFLWFNQWRGYSSDRFTKEEKSQFDYSNGIIKQISKDPISSTFEDKEKKILKYHQFEVAIVLDEPIIEDEEQINEITGFIFAKELRFKQGDVLSFKTEKKEERVKKIVINSYYRVIPVIPNPTDWKFRLVSLNKTLSEWCTENNTVGSYFYSNFYCQKQIERIRTNIVNRNWYEDELKKIWKMQYTEHKEYFKNHCCPVKEIEPS